jgi:hypothetical protein
MRIYNILFIIFIVFFSCSEKKKNIIQGEISSDGGQIILLDAVKDKKIYLSDIAKNINIKILETTEESLIGDIIKLDIDEDYYFILNSIDKLVYVFDREGRFKRRIGQRGAGPEEIQYPECFAIDRSNKEVWLTNNFLSISKYNYEGKFIGKQNINIKFRDFYIADDGNIYFHTSKLFNFSELGNPICANLWVMDPKGDIKTFFPYDPLIYPNGELYFDTKIPFNQSKSNTATYNHVFCDTIYSLDGNIIKPAYIIDFGDKKAKIDFTSTMGEKVMKYFLDNFETASYVQNYIETEHFLRFNYVMGTQLYDAFYDKKMNKVVEGILVNDILGAHIEFRTHSEDRLIGYMNAFEIKINDKTDRYIDSETISKLQAIDQENNPILIEIELKNLE